MQTLIQLKNRFNKVEAAYSILHHVKRDQGFDPPEEGIHLNAAIESLEKELSRLDKSLYLLRHGTPLVVSVTDWVKTYWAKRRNL